MKYFITLLLFFLPVLDLSAEDLGDFFVRILPDRETIYTGDSMKVSVVLYSAYPIAKAEATSDFKVKGKCGVRRLTIYRDATIGRVRENGRVYYTMVWAQYVLSPTQSDTYTIPAQKFKATLQQVVRMPDFFDQMMGAQPEYKEIKVTGASKTFTFKTTEKPLRSTQDVIKSGGTIL